MAHYCRVCGKLLYRRAKKCSDCWHEETRLGLLRRRLREGRANRTAKHLIAKPALRDELADDDRVYDREQVEFMMAMQREKERLGRHNGEGLRWHEVLAVAIKLGYRKQT